MNSIEQFIQYLLHRRGNLHIMLLLIDADAATSVVLHSTLDRLFGGLDSGTAAPIKIIVLDLVNELHRARYLALVFPSHLLDSLHVLCLLLFRNGEDIRMEHLKLSFLHLLCNGFLVYQVAVDLAHGVVHLVVA